MNDLCALDIHHDIFMVDQQLDLWYHFCILNRTKRNLEAVSRRARGEREEKIQGLGRKIQSQRLLRIP
jgi:hypothetical protein